MTVMTKIDTSKWKEFIIGDLFEKLQLDIKNENFNKALDVSEEQNEEFNLPLVNAKHGNNGIMYYGRESDFDIAELTIDIVQNGAIATGDVYAQPQKTGVLWDAYLVKPKSAIDSPFTLMFLATVMEKSIKDKFSYDNKCVWDKARLLPISLPVDVTGEPDWAYMHEYMSEIVKESEVNLASLMKADNEKHEVNTSEWKEFTIGDLFNIHPTKAYKKINIELFEDDGTNPVVVNTGFNNGVGGYSNLDCTEKAGTITFTDTAAKSTDSFFYQEKDFIGYPHVQGMYAKTHEWTRNEGLFLNSVIKSILNGRYDFIRKMTRAEMLKLKVKLPAVKRMDGTYIPDWAYMEELIHSVMKDAEIDLTAMQTIF